MRYKPNKDEFFFKKSSLAASLHKSQYGDEEVMIYDRRTHRIVMIVKPADVTLKYFMGLQPIRRKKRRKVKNG